MKALLSRLVLVAATLWLTGYFVLTAGRLWANPDFVLAVLPDKVRALENVPGERLVLVGGSNLTFGVNSRELSRLCGRPVLNTALHAGLGLDFPLWLVGQRLHSGDIVLISPEYGVYAPNPDVMAQALLFLPKGLEYVDERFPASDAFRFRILSMQKAAAALHQRLYLAIGGPESWPRRQDFSPEGDMLGHLDRPRPAGSLQDFQLKPTDYSPALQIIDQFQALAQSRGARVLYAYPVACESFVRSNRQTIEIQEQQLKGLSCPVINRPETDAYPDEMFFDTVYHAGREARDLRTRSLARAIAPYLPGH